MPFWHLHAHSRYSVNDAMPAVEAMVAKVKAMGQPALAITDHGNMAASVELYQACAKAGITPFPGSEMYFVPDTMAYRTDRADKSTKATMGEVHPLEVVADHGRRVLGECSLDPGGQVVETGTRADERHPDELADLGRRHRGR